MRRWDLIEPGIASILVSLRRCLFDRPEKGLRRRLGLDSADPYVVLCLVVLLGLCLLLALAPQKGAIRQALASIAVLGAAYRFGDILTHHLCSMFVEPKVPRSAIRVLEIAFINFIQAILCFGIGFYFIESWFPDSFAPSSEILGIGQAIYLSLAIMTTVGAGNIYPVTIWGKLLAATAVLTGLILVAFVITRHMAYYAERQKKLVSRTEAAINHVDPRPERDEYLMSVAVDQAARCNCRKTPVGAIIARDDRVISTGYNGTIAGYDTALTVHALAVRIRLFPRAPSWTAAYVSTPRRMPFLRRLGLESE